MHHISDIKWNDLCMLLNEIDFKVQEAEKTNGTESTSGWFNPADSLGCQGAVAPVSNDIYEVTQR